jgi:hypothetical protein
MTWLLVLLTILAEVGVDVHILLTVLLIMMVYGMENSNLVDGLVEEARVLRRRCAVYGKTCLNMSQIC